MKASLQDSNYLGVLLEEIRDQNKAVLEAVGGMQRELATVPKRDEFEELKSDVKIVKAAVTDISTQVANHERQLLRRKAA